MKAKKVLNSFLTEEGKELIAKAVDRAEHSTAGEIRVAVIGKVEGKDIDKATKNRALEEFKNLGMEATRDHTGVLIVIFPVQKKVWVLGDKAIDEKVPEGTWDKAVEMIVSGIKEGTNHKGICEAVEFIGDYLSDYFPVKVDDADELSDEVIVRG